MTDGIIQKVFGKYIHMIDYPDSLWVSQIQQELIEEIKKTFNNEESIVNVKSEPTGLFHIEDIFAKLIGDNQ